MKKFQQINKIILVLYNWHSMLDLYLLYELIIMFSEIRDKKYIWYIVIHFGEVEGERVELVGKCVGVNDGKTVGVNEGSVY